MAAIPEAVPAVIEVVETEEIVIGTAIGAVGGIAMEIGAAIVIIGAMSVIRRRLTMTPSHTVRLVILITIRTTVLALTIAATTTGSTRARTMAGADRRTIRNVPTFTRLGPTAIVPAKAAAMHTSWLIAMAFCAGIAKATKIGRNILSEEDSSGN